MGILILPKRGYDGAEILTVLIEGVILHADEKFSEKLVTKAFADDISDNG